MADLSSYMRSKQPNNCSNSMESALINLAASIKKLVEEDDSLPLSCKWSPIEITKAWCFLNNPQRTVSHSSSQALMWHSDYHGSSFLKVFIPITTFSPLAGGHKFIPFSHVHKPLAYEDTRYSEEYINSFYGISPEKDERFNIELRSGDVLIENTSGLHKGIPPTESPRLMLVLLIQNGIVIN